jgi:hypothetical protein
VEGAAEQGEPDMDERPDLMREICVSRPSEKGDDTVLGRGWKQWRGICVVNGQGSLIRGGVTSVSLYVYYCFFFAGSTYIIVADARSIN